LAGKVAFQLQTADFYKLLTGLARGRRIQDKKMQITAEKRKRRRVLDQYNWENVSEELELWRRKDLRLKKEGKGMPE
jgi:hypothetical protein